MPTTRRRWRRRRSCASKRQGTRVIASEWSPVVLSLGEVKKRVILRELCDVCVRETCVLCAGERGASERGRDERREGVCVERTRAGISA